MLHIIIYEGVSLDCMVHHIPLPSHLHPFQTCDHMCNNIVVDDVGRKHLWRKSFKAYIAVGHIAMWYREPYTQKVSQKK